MWQEPRLTLALPAGEGLQALGPSVIPLHIPETGTWPGLGYLVKENGFWGVVGRSKRG
jgi:hypothetical protein